MQNFLKWTLDAIREEDSLMSWMEERRFEWVPLAATFLEKVLYPYTFVIITDPKREWFEKYILSTINNSNSNRPYLPFVSLKAYYQDIDSIRNKEDFELVNDMLSLSHSDKFIFFYIGNSEHSRAKLAKYKDDSFLWVFGSQVANSFNFNAKDKNLDLKLIQLFKLFNKSIDAVLFGEITLGD